MNLDTESNIETNIGPDTESNIETNIDPDTESNIDPDTKSNIETNIDPDTKSDKREVELETKECCICLENIKDNNILLPCNHTFHIYCIIRWIINRLEKQAPHSCPFCKSTYNYKVLVSTILSDMQYKVRGIIRNLEYLNKNCILDNSEKIRVATYKNHYTNDNNQITYLIENYYSELHTLHILVQFRINPLPADVNDWIIIRKKRLTHHKPFNFIKHKGFCLCSCIKKWISSD